MMGEVATNSTPVPPVSPPATVLEYRRVEPIARQVSDRERRNTIGGFVAFFLFIALLAAMRCQWSYPHVQHERDVDRWLEVELQRRMYEISLRKRMPLSTPPAAPAPVIVRPWASALMTAGDAMLLVLALFAHRLVRRLDHLRRPPLLGPGRIWRAVLTIAVAQLFLSLACVGLDAWRIFTTDFLFVGCLFVGVILAEVLARFAAGASFPEALQRFNFVKDRDEVRIAS